MEPAEVWQSEHAFHRPGRWVLPAEMGKNVSCWNVEGTQAAVPWQLSHVVGKPEVACAGFVVALYCWRWQEEHCSERPAYVPPL